MTNMRKKVLPTLAVITILLILFIVCLKDNIEKSINRQKYHSFLAKYEQNYINLSDFQIEEVENIVKAYCNKLILKQPNISDITLLSIETGSKYIEYKCILVRENHGSDFATIYVLMHEDGTFEVQGLELD